MISSSSGQEHAEHKMADDLWSLWKSWRHEHQRTRLFIWEIVSMLHHHKTRQLNIDTQSIHETNESNQSNLIMLLIHGSLSYCSQLLEAILQCRLWTCVSRFTVLTCGSRVLSHGSLYFVLILSSLSFGPEVDECQINPYICGRGICYNTAEGYTCHCDEGYRLDDSQTTCVGEEPSGQRSSCVCPCQQPDLTNSMLLYTSVS